MMQNLPSFRFRYYNSKSSKRQNRLATGTRWLVLRGASPWVVPVILSCARRAAAAHHYGMTSIALSGPQSAIRRRWAGVWSSV
jgi:hypothetical protein